ncbi:hypothetical protein ACA910_020166 [Epithemia clementina (nom. ined.)]
MFFFCCRRRKFHPHGKPVQYYNHHHRPAPRGSGKSPCSFRHPLVVFCLSFVALASLRFRVRTKKAAQNLIQRGRNRISAGSSSHASIPNPTRATTILVPRHASSQPPQSLQQQQQEGPLPQGIATSTTTAMSTNKGNPKNEPGTPPLVTSMARTRVKSSTARTIAYELTVEENPSTRKRSKVLRFRAVWVPVSHNAPATSTEASHPSVTVQEWVQHMLMPTTEPSLSSSSSSFSWLDQFIQILQSGNSFAAYFFETKGVTPSTAATTSFEFVLVDAPELLAFVTTTQQQKQYQQQQKQKQYQQQQRNPPNGPETARSKTHQKHPNRGLLVGGSIQQQQKQQQPPLAFADQFRKCHQKDSALATTTCVFANLGGDAILVAPQPPYDMDNHDSNNNNNNHVMNYNSYGHLASFVRQAPYAQVREFWTQVLETYAQQLQIAIDIASSSSSSTTAKQQSSWFGFLFQLGRDGATLVQEQSSALPLSASLSSSSSPSSSSGIRLQPRPEQESLLSFTSKQARPQESRLHSKNHDNNNDDKNNNNNNNMSNNHDKLEANQPVWLSTSGMGIAWLHMRLDQVPKYYTYTPFVTLSER